MNAVRYSWVLLEQSTRSLMGRSSGGAFRVRSPQRDRRRDIDRLRCAGVSIRKALDESRTERQGLELRIRSEVVDAGFLSEALADGQSSAACERRLKDLSQSIVDAERRLNDLAEQIRFLDDLNTRLDRFLRSKPAD